MTGRESKAALPNLSRSVCRTKFSACSTLSPSCIGSPRVLNTLISSSAAIASSFSWNEASAAATTGSVGHTNGAGSTAAGMIPAGGNSDGGSVAARASSCEICAADHIRLLPFIPCLLGTQIINQA
eukprot:CAMPEP_0119312542 /NCGR_PEP_ID=MMETSP1333-20130426/26864_1 /TAXON_ID=418940 /ORGANISM="Scyphosphaera apsteinii, Strain RCC1455" /LENGTH=125 /DNA_ID=CAMNT_0007317183 /DNA_START=781 /DNA_END=1158 /DNA_ORIENTATION=-